ncbi:hypothetical protein ACFOD0_03320 [Shewanella intestini]|uniref:hypothetical protein n=1 Tax=Shewanella TaxID=22 RepID=UPI00188EBE0A|nr:MULTISPECIES: hypothetical protein [Shewanella]
MKKLISLSALAATPTLALAHEGHGGVGLFHHMVDLVPAIALVAVVGFIIWKRTR